jgi:hypothetical protein
MKRPESFIVLPRTYWLWPRGMSVFYWVLGVMMIASDWWPIFRGTKKADFHDIIFPSLYLLLACFATLMAYRTFIRLSADAIEVRHLWGSQILPFHKIKGRRRYTEKADPYSTPPRHLVLESNDDRFPRLDMKEAREFDESFYRWFDSLPDLDKLDGIIEPQSKYTNFSLV